LKRPLLLFILFEKERSHFLIDTDEVNAY